MGFSFLVKKLYALTTDVGRVEHMLPLSEALWAHVCKLYKIRSNLHKKLLMLRSSGAVDEYLDLALGISDRLANYYSVEVRKQALLVRHLNSPDLIMSMADKFLKLEDGRDVPTIVRDAGLLHVGLATGSEIACLLNPRTCWVTNRRTIWVHLFDSGGADAPKTDAKVSALKLYERPAFHIPVGITLAKLGEIHAARAHSEGIQTDLTFLWADAVADGIYASEHDARLIE